MHVLLLVFLGISRPFRIEIIQGILLLLGPPGPPGPTNPGPPGPPGDNSNATFKFQQISRINHWISYWNMRKFFLLLFPQLLTFTFFSYQGHRRKRKVTTTQQQRQLRGPTFRPSEVPSDPTPTQEGCRNYNLNYFDIIRMFSCHFTSCTLNVNKFQFVEIISQTLLFII